MSMDPTLYVQFIWIGLGTGFAPNRHQTVAIDSNQAQMTSGSLFFYFSQPFIYFQ